MIRHIVLWKLHEQAEGDSKFENARKAKTMLEALRGKIPGLVSLEVGIDCLGTKDSADLSLSATFENLEALERHKEHPDHRKLVPFMSAIQSTRTVIDYEI